MFAKFYITQMSKTKNPMIKYNSMRKLIGLLDDYGMIIFEEKSKQPPLPYKNSAAFVKELLKALEELDQKAWTDCMGILPHILPTVNNKDWGAFMKKAKFGKLEKEVNAKREEHPFDANNLTKGEKKWLKARSSPSKKAKPAAIEQEDEAGGGGGDVISSGVDIGGAAGAPSGGEIGPSMPPGVPAQFDQNHLLMLKFGPQIGTYDFRKVTDFVDALPDSFNMNWALMEDMVAQGGGSSAFGDGTGMDIVNGTTIPLNPERVISEAKILIGEDWTLIFRRQ
ncbi:hypothetical protein RFI_38013 [Reticulomyxa filosa]|uniref:Uncharacterized protein n=1 Tax=Reticulomyxa filosa TaxID=46433 RepID=X6LEC3_RETFI|nr:hypothetical protein RFI_38013 [Reticulomyxa filosa]|eukprot:ETN99461.1 hypothetical protein RFI_38013 [Reticulomyxa filosa]